MMYGKEEKKKMKETEAPVDPTIIKKRSMIGLEYDQNEVQRRWLSWQWAVKAGKHSYAGTVNPEAKAKRRAKNKIAKASRKANR